jgi:hypothetical protein
VCSLGFRSFAYDFRSPFETFLKEEPPTQSEQEPKWAFILRTLGLRVLYSLYLVCRRRKSGEPKKEAISYRKRSACAGSLIHVIPVSAAIGIVSLNLSGYYIGRDLAGAIDQNAAKINGL